MLTIGRNIEHLRSQREHAIKRKEKVVKTKFNTVLEKYTGQHEEDYPKSSLNKKDSKDKLDKKFHVSREPDKDKIYCNCKDCKYRKHNKIEIHAMKYNNPSMNFEVDKYI